MDKISEHVKKITDPIFDVCCANGLTLGETLTVLLRAKAELDREIANLQETINTYNPKGGK